MTTHRQAFILAAVPLMLAACAPAPSPPPPSPAALAPNASTSTAPTTTPTDTPLSTPMPSPTALPPEVTGWVTRTFDPDNDCCGIDDAAIGSNGTIHAVDHVEEAWNPGGFDAGRYRRSRDGGRTWDAEHQFPGIDEVVAAVGDRVFVAFRAYTCRREAVAFVRNVKNGAPNAWSKVICLPGEPDFGSEWGPKVAASGSSAYVISIDAPTRKMHLRTSHDAGRTFASKLLGDARPDADDFVSPVVLDADGDLVAASWPDKGKSVIRISHDGGRSWGPAIPMPSLVEDLDVRDGRILVQGPISVEERWYGLASDGGFEPIDGPQPMIAPSSAAPAPRLVLGPAGALGELGYDSACGTVWRTSADGGVTWSLPERIVATCSVPMFGGIGPMPVSWLDDGRITVFLDGDEPLIAARP